MLYGRTVLMPVMGRRRSRHDPRSASGRIHHFRGIFMVGLVWITVQWMPLQLPHWTDCGVARQGRRLLLQGRSSAAKKFNAGQKIIFWLVVLLGGISVSLSGWRSGCRSSSRCSPRPSPRSTRHRHRSADAALGDAGNAAQSALAYHRALFLTAVIVAHIYIGSIGMEGGFEAMGSGKVDLNWAKEHHSLWVEGAGPGADRTGNGRRALRSTAARRNSVTVMRGLTANIALAFLGLALAAAAPVRFRGGRRGAGHAETQEPRESRGPWRARARRGNHADGRVR